MDNLKTGALIRELRKEKGLTQLALAEQLHITDRAVSKWERGICAPDIALLEPLSHALGTTVTELITGQREIVTEVAVTSALTYSGQELARKIVLLRKRMAALLLGLCLLLPLLNRFVCNNGFVWECVPAWLCARQAATALEDGDGDKITAYLAHAEAIPAALAELENQGTRILSATVPFSRALLEDGLLMLEIEFVVEHEDLCYQLTCPGIWRNGRVELMHVLYSGTWEACPEWLWQFSSAIATYAPG